jgi:phosphoserine phosphatase
MDQPHLSIPDSPLAVPPAADVVHSNAGVPLGKMREILDVSRFFAVQANLDDLLPTICRAATSIIGADRCSLFLHDPASRQLWTKVATGVSSGEIRVPDTAGIVGLVFQSRNMLVIPDAYADARFNRAVDQKTGYRTHNLLTVPVFDLEGQPVAVLQLINKLVSASPQAIGAFTHIDELVAQLLADQVGVAIQRFHLQQKAIEGAAMQKELELARRVQERLLPKTPPILPGLECAGWNKPATTTGGDVYDLWITSDGRLGIFLADATGHGIAPALVVSQARALVRALADRLVEPPEILAQVNSRLAADLDSGMFVTAFLGILSASGQLRWCSAGQAPILVRTSPDAEVTCLTPPAPPLAVMEEFMCDATEPLQLQKGGWLAIVSDGITESWSPDRQQLSDERLLDCLHSHACNGPEPFIQSLRECLLKWQREREPSDDQTIVMVRRT